MIAKKKGKPFPFFSKKRGMIHILYCMHCYYAIASSCRFKCVVCKVLGLAISEVCPECIT